MSQQQLNHFLNLPESELNHWLNGNRESISAAFFNEGKQYAEQLANDGDLTNALKTFEKLSIAATSREDLVSQALIWRGKANVYQLYEQYHNSLTSTQHAVEILEQVGTPFDIAVARTSEVAVLGALAQFEEAIALAHWIRPFFQKKDFSLGLASVSLNLAKVYAMSWQIDEAIAEYETAASHYAAIEMADYVAYIEIDVAILHSQQGNYTLSQNCYANISSKLTQDDTMLLIKIHINWAESLLLQGKYEAALSHLSQARDYLSQTPHSVDRGFVNLFEARIFQELVKLDNAKTLLTDALADFKETNQQIEVCETLLDLAQITAQSGYQADILEGINYLEQASQHLTAVNLPFFTAWIQLEQAKLFFQLKRLIEAESLAAKASRTFATAQLSYRQAQADLLLADCQPEKTNSAIALYQKVLAKFEVQDPLLAVRCYSGLGKIALTQAKWETAVSYFTEATNTLDQIRSSLRSHGNQAGFLENKQDIAAGLLTAVSQQSDQKSNLLRWTEQFKASALADMLAKQPQDHSLNQDLRQLLDEREQLVSTLDTHLKALHKNVQTFSVSQRSAPVVAHDSFQMKALASLRQEIEAIDDKIAQFQDPSQAWREGESISIDQMHALLDEDTIGIAYFETNDGLQAITFTNQSDDIEVHPLLTTSEKIAQQWKKSRRHVARPKRPLTAVQPLLAHLYEQLIAPLEQRLQAKKRLLILPHRALFHIPFAGLYHPSSESYLIDKWTIQIAPSATILKWCQDRQTNSQNSLLMGYPGEQEQADYLPKVLEEVETLSTLFDEPTVLRANDATRENLLTHLSNKSLIHLAGHAVFNSQFPLESGLPLVNGRWLRASDLYLRQGLIDGATVVLSGCETGLGQLSGADILGLNSAFLYAGASGIVSGLWKVDDNATAVLMKHFYQNLKDGMDTAVALQQAQLTLRHSNEFSAPYFWAPFALTGEAKPIG
ncbi:MAG: CHAT domain-containing protein [Chloroflexota bacterium]